MSQTEHGSSLEDGAGTLERRSRWAASCTALGCALLFLGCKKDAAGTAPGPTSAPATAPAPSVSPEPLVTTTGAASPGVPPTDVRPPTVCNAVASRAAIRREARNKAGEPRIIGGRQSEWPFAVAITSNGLQSGQYCGGSLIGKDAVLTAAHCQVATTDKVIVGRTDLTLSSSGKVLAVREVKNHAAYDPDTHDNDIAVLKLAESVPNETLRIYDGSSDLSGQQALVVGWGYTREGGPQSPKLLEVEVPVIGNSLCSTGYAPDRVGITSNMLCAGLAQGGKDSCQGDSGGPLVVKGSDGKWLQAGVVSFGIGCARPNRYGVYTRVANFAPWIHACSE
jgi:secreted trypsin-like serine protease